ncbi:MAG: response regulator, partial [Thermodesulfobacteriota bacterium]|nr:response regulator [Thermodesulfobacteriota bacterium]
DFYNDHFHIERGDYVLLTVSDNGYGMNKDTVEHIFEPFYTTKGTGKGTGLGLAMVYGIVKSHGGYITCRSKPGKGTTFKIYLPAAEQEMKVNEVRCEEMLKLKGGRETIMFVDDEAYLRDLGEQILNEFGYTVFTAPDGESALELYRDKCYQVDLVILDLIMPGMGGARCLDEILKINNQAKIIIASGYSSDEEQKVNLESKVKGFIHKPYGVDKILDVVREQLDQSPANGTQDDSTPSTG